MRVYIPMTCNVLVPGHIRLIDELLQYGEVIIGLLTKDALDGYKQERMPLKDRMFVLDRAVGCPEVYIVPQTSLDPSDNIKMFACDALATGDRFEEVEQAAIEKLNLKPLVINSGHSLHSSHV